MKTHTDFANFKSVSDVYSWLNDVWKYETPNLEIVKFVETEGGPVFGVVVIDRDEEIGYAWDFVEGVFGLDAFTNNARTTMSYFTSRASSLAYYHSDGRFIRSESPLAPAHLGGK